jgi:hypothetical protein
VAPHGDPPGGLLDAAAESLGRALAALHARALPAFGRLTPDLDVVAPASARWSEDLTRRVASRLDNPAHGLDEARRKAVRIGFARLLAHVSEGAPIGAVLVHGDLSPGNILLEAAVGEGPGSTRPAAPGDVGLTAPDDVSLAAPGEVRLAAPGEADPAFSGQPRLRGLVDWEMARAADPAHDLASLRIELAGRWPAFARRAEHGYLAAVAGRAAAEPSAGDGRRRPAGRDPDGPRSANDWQLRVAAASVPILLDARMVAHRRRNRGALDRVDALLAAALAGPAD